VLVDELRYYGYASNLIHGFYSPPAPNILLWNGPGYPIAIIPFVIFKLPMIVISMFNAFLYYLSLVFMYKILIGIVSYRKAFVFSMFMGINLNAIIMTVMVMAESLTVFLITLLIYFIIKAFEGKSRKYLMLSGFIIGYIALTKFIFAYVILVLVVLFFLLWIFSKRNIYYQKSLKIFLVAFITILPYLTYTYCLTGKYFYLGNSGGQQLYWMSTPYANEYGDWRSPLLSSKEPIPRVHSFDTIFKNRHINDINIVLNNPQHSLALGIEQDSIFKSLAIRNIVAHPTKYTLNCIYNLGRMFFNFPYSYALQSPLELLLIPYNMILAVLILLCLIPTLINWKKISYPLRFLFIFAWLYILASTLLSAYPRMLVVITPILLYWIILILKKMLKIKWRFD
jgi:4-amino-4-deoxy-L-arabinose transferase-like glycosyltransferase